MKFPYNNVSQPPIPMIEISLSLPGGDHKTDTLYAILDTGADGSLVPQSYIETLSATYVDEVMLRSQWGEWRAAAMYLIDVHIGDRTLPGVYIVGDEMGSDIILGRNVLNSLRLLLDRPARQVEVLDL
jgi:predicted aspartyl protease